MVWGLDTRFWAEKRKNFSTDFFLNVNFAVSDLIQLSLKTTDSWHLSIRRAIKLHGFG